MTCFVGITGTIASGKSLVTAILIKIGYQVFDADLCVKHLYKKQEIQKQVLHLFPNLSKIDKDYISRKIYLDNSKRLGLNKIFHPVVKNELLKYFASNKEQSIVFADIPLLYEANFEQFFDHIICAYAPRHICLQRFKDRSDKKDSENLFNLINASQIALVKKRFKSCFIAYTHDTKCSLNTQIINIISRIKYARNCSRS